MGDFSHLDKDGRASMVDVGGKRVSERMARVSGVVTVSLACAELLNSQTLAEITTTARIAGIQAAKRTAELIPLCHQVGLDKVDIDIRFLREAARFELSALSRSTGVTGVEMESFCAVQMAALTIYDMLKAVCPEAVLGPFSLEEKHGGKAGQWARPKETL